LAQAIGWAFVALIAYHGVLAAIRAVEAGDDRNWSYAVELAAIALTATLVVGAAVVAALRAFTRTR
jgi:hypothetical protein